MDNLEDKSKAELIEILENYQFVNDEKLPQLFDELIKKSKSKEEGLLLRTERLAIDLKPNYLYLERYSNLTLIKESIDDKWVSRLEAIYERRTNVELKSKYADLLFCLSPKDIVKGERAIKCFERVKPLHFQAGEKRKYLDSLNRLLALSIELNKEIKIRFFKEEHLNLLIKNFVNRDLKMVIETIKSMLLTPKLLKKEDLEIIDTQIEDFLNKELEECMFDRINLQELHLKILKLKLDEFRYKKSKCELGLLYETIGNLSPNVFKIKNYEKAMAIYEELGLTDSKVKQLRLKMSLQNLN